MHASFMATTEEKIKQICFDANMKVYTLSFLVFSQTIALLINHDVNEASVFSSLVEKIGDGMSEDAIKSNLIRYSKKIQKSDSPIIKEIMQGKTNMSTLSFLYCMADWIRDHDALMVWNGTSYYEPHWQKKNKLLAAYPL